MGEVRISGLGERPDDEDGQRNAGSKQDKVDRADGGYIMRGSKCPTHSARAP